ncbi:unnamed protein product [Adineta steineri]|uniref:Uncharacterized protein n=1 Tax=Adineta steineri TaxID=433720 RepID=A0A819PZR5_9BILA|nr:unnamed protein product [Adineta steineri]CAF4021226.1 unnamed protein product [Adineta steineri]
MASNSAEHEDSGDPKNGKKLDCKGRPCAKCHKCRDWRFIGGHDTWIWITNWKNWTNDEWSYFDNDRIYMNFTKHDGATCSLSTYGYIDYPVPLHRIYLDSAAADNARRIDADHRRPGRPGCCPLPGGSYSRDGGVYIYRGSLRHVCVCELH